MSALERECRCWCRVPLQGAAARCPWPRVLWGLGADAAARPLRCQRRVAVRALELGRWCHRAIWSLDAGEMLPDVGSVRFCGLGKYMRLCALSTLGDGPLQARRAWPSAL